MQLSPVIETASGQSVPRVHTVDPADMVRSLRAAAERTGLVSYHPGHPVVDLALAADGLGVAGIHLDDGTVHHASPGVTLQSFAPAAAVRGGGTCAMLTGDPATLADALADLLWQARA